MITRLEETRSRLAAVSADLAALAPPVLIIVAIGHRARLLDTTTTFAVLALGFGLAGLAVITALAAFGNIWRDGRRGAGLAMRGLLIGGLVLVLPAIAAWRLVTEPQLVDITTSLDDPPRFTRVLQDREAADLVPRRPEPVEAALQQRIHPDLVSRYYPVGTQRVYEEARAIAARRGWELFVDLAPDESVDTGRIEATAVTAVFGFRHDVALRIAPEGEGTLVDMRSAARRASHDLGVNARRIRSFLSELDVALQGVTGG